MPSTETTNGRSPLRVSDAAVDNLLVNCGDVAGARKCELSELQGVVEMGLDSP